MPRNRDADRAEAERLIAALRVQVASINEVVRDEEDEQAAGEIVQIATDLAFAADQFAALCKVTLHEQMLFGVAPCCPPQEAERVVQGAVATFLARYRAG